MKHMTINLPRRDLALEAALEALASPDCPFGYSIAARVRPAAGSNLHYLHVDAEGAKGVVKAQWVNGAWHSTVSMNKGHYHEGFQ